MKNQKNERGITLVALVVTIVVLLILAGITIMYVMSDNGVFGQAQNAGSETNINAVREAVEMAISGLYPEVYTSDAVDNAALGTALTTSFESNLSATMKGTGFTNGTVTAEKGNVSTLSMTGCAITYKGVPYTVTYDVANGVKVVGGGLTSTTVAGTSKTATP